MNQLSVLRQKVLSEFRTVVDLTERSAPAPLHEAAQQAWHRLAEERYRVVVCGEFKRGKSTLLNALVDRAGLFPVDVQIATSVVIELSYSATELVRVHFGSAMDRPDDVPDPVEITVDRIGDYATEQGNPFNEKNVIRIEVGLPLAELRQGLILVDTPGIGSMNPAHGVVTRAEILSADALIFVTSAQEGLSTNELDFLADAIEVCPTVITAVTFIDMVVDPAQAIAETAQKIATLAGRPVEELTVVGVAAPRKHDAADDDDPELLTESGFPLLERQLWDGLAETCGRARVAAVLDTWLELVETLRQPLADQIAALRAGSSASGIRSQLDEIRKELADLDKALPTEAAELANGFDRATRPVLERLADDFDALGDGFRDATNRPTPPDEPAKLAKQTISLTVDIADRAGRELRAAAVAVAVQYGLGNAFTAAADDLPGGPRGATDELTIRTLTERSAFSRLRTRFSGVVIGGGAGAAIGAIAGSFIPVVGTALGAAAGALVGKIGGFFAGKKENERQEALAERRDTVAQLRDYVLPRLDSARRAAERSVGALGRDLAMGLEQARRAHRQTRREMLQERAKSLTAALQDNQQERAARIAALEEILDLYGRLIEQQDALREQLDALGDQAGDRSGV
ncbi:dynamin family protein [Solwaraspora sp. WMMD791]|uniref:dynamin family protein n=1 Tax=Solwaraspora sp. WMMD791 TaxID=3016086 RepID=UPI00249B6329|nr:dynamin family protein [Solwaraspora sp. WMMD791]WFE24863.1 dynamin family protein [Solwaraspora sp. WMMD791]